MHTVQLTSTHSVDLWASVERNSRTHGTVVVRRNGIRTGGQRPSQTPVEVSKLARLSRPSLHFAVPEQNRLTLSVLRMLQAQVRMPLDEMRHLESKLTRPAPKNCPVVCVGPVHCYTNCDKLIGRIDQTVHLLTNYATRESTHK